MGADPKSGPPILRVHGKPFRRRGLGTLVCAAFIEQCLEEDLIPDWHTGLDNLGSIALARKLGYRLIGDEGRSFDIDVDVSGPKDPT